MPSEIARLVYGYIDDLDGCKDVAKQFLETCPLLREFAEGFRCGARYSAKINNRTLLDFLQNLPEERSDNSISTNSLKPFNEDLLISTVKATITKTFEDALRKESANSSRSFSQIKEEQAELKSILKRDLLPKIREVVKDAESNILQSFRDQNNINSSGSTHLLKTPKRNHKYQGFTQQDLENGLANTSKAPFSPAAHSSMLSTPKRKSTTPRRLAPHTSSAGQYLASRIPSEQPQDSPQISFQSNSPYTDPPSQYSQISAFTSSPGCTDSSELDLQTFQNQVLSDFVECGSKPEVANRLAGLINSALEPFRPSNTASIEETNNDAAIQQSMQQQQQQQPLSNNAVSTDTQNDNHMFNHPDQMTEFLGTATNACNEDPDLKSMVDSIIFYTPFKSFMPVTPSSGSTSNGSLNTPLVNFCDTLSNKENTGNTDLMPVKNFNRQLASPAKNNNSQSRLESSLSSVSNSFNNASAGSDDIHNVTVVESTAKHNTSTKSAENNSSYLSCNDSSSSMANASLSKSKPSTSSQSHRMDTSLNSNEPNGGRPTQSSSSSISKPVFLNQHLKSSSNTSKKPSFSRLVAQQESIKKSLNYSGTFDVSFSSSKTEKEKLVAVPSKANKGPSSSSQGRLPLTTTITKVSEGVDPPTKIPTTNSTASSVQTIGFQAVSSHQVISSTQANISASQPTQTTFIVPPGMTLWDPDTGIATNTADQPLIVQGNYQLCDFQTQISSTSQNIYLPPNFGKGAGNQQQAETATNSITTSSMPMITLVNAGNSRLITDNSNTNFNGNRKSASNNRPSILSKSGPNSPFCKGPTSQSAHRQLSGDPASPTLRSRKEPRKSNLGKRSFPEDDDEPAGQRQTDEQRSLPSQPKKGGAINDGRVKALMTADIDVFLQKVHKGSQPNVDNKRSNDAGSSKKRSSSARSERSQKKSPGSKGTKRFGGKGSRK